MDRTIYSVYKWALLSQDKLYSRTYRGLLSIHKVQKGGLDEGVFLTTPNISINTWTFSVRRPAHPLLEETYEEIRAAKNFNTIRQLYANISKPFTCQTKHDEYIITTTNDQHYYLRG